VPLALSGLFGALLVAVYFAAPLRDPALVKLFYGPPPGTQAVVDLGRQYHDLLFLGTWLQATGALLSVVFFLGLVQMAGATTRLSGLVVLLGAATLVALVLIEGVFTLTWASASVSGHEASALAGFDQQAGFIHVFPIVPAPAVYLALGAILLSAQVLPRLFAYLALALGAAFVVVGLVAVFVPLATAAAGVLSFGQDLWILAAAIALPLGQKQ
jgi:hypothetical protein